MKTRVAIALCALALLAAVAAPLAQNPAQPPQPQGQVPAPPPANPAALQPGDIVITGGQLFDGVRDTLVPNTGLVIRHGIFLEVGAALSGRDLGPAQVIRLDADQTILPGLFDLHAHYAVDLFGQGRVDEYTANPLIFLGNGITSTFPAGEVDPEGMMAARRRIERGEQVGPRIMSSGPYFGTARPHWSNATETPEQIRKEVDEWAAKGVRGFKAKGIQPAQLVALIDQAHRYGLTVTGHLDSGFRNSVNPRDAIYMGIDRIEHFMGGDAITGDKNAYASLQSLDLSRPEVDAIFKLYLQRNVYYDATVSAYGYWYNPKDERVYPDWDEQRFLTPHAREVVDARTKPQNAQFKLLYEVKLKEVKRFYDAGGARLITVGTDHPSWGEYWSGFGTHRELRALAVAGIPPAAALKMATINPARAIGMGDKLGSIEAGKFSDLVVIRGNPLQDITTTHNVERVMVRGDLYDAKALLEQAKGTLGPKTAADDEWWKGNVRFK
jgi:imidazolonepropionase-like amidohydrolase